MEADSSSPVAGEVRSRRRAIDLKKIAAYTVAVASLVAGVVLWATSRLEAKANADDVQVLSTHVEAQFSAVNTAVQAIQLKNAKREAADAWRDATLWKVADKLGIPVPQPPTLERRSP